MHNFKFHVSASFYLQSLETSLRRILSRLPTANFLRLRICQHIHFYGKNGIGRSQY